MRIGVNPGHSISAPKVKRHRIIIPLYVPNKKDYFEDVFEIFKISFCTLLQTINLRNVNISVISDGCIDEVSEYLWKEYEKGNIDRLILSGQNRGKAHSIIAEISASNEEFITLADADVYFLSGWLGEVEKLFFVWPNAGAVSPSGQSKTAFHKNDCTWAHGFLHRQLRRGSYASVDDLNSFSLSLGRLDFYSEKEKESQFALEKNGVIALIGAGHFIVTVRRECYENFYFKSGQPISRYAFRKIDSAVNDKGYLRLTTRCAYALHMGNKIESWMQKGIAKDNPKEEGSTNLQVENIPRCNPRSQAYLLILKIVGYTVKYLARAYYKQT